MEKTIRQPQQERSNEKKQKIIEASYELFTEVGYYKTNTSDIARRAGVSTGILLYVLNIYIRKVTEPLSEVLESTYAPVDFDRLIGDFIDATIKIHRENAHLHNTLHSLEVSDEDVNDEFMELQNTITEKVSEKLISLGYNPPYLKERVHLAMNAIQSFAHESVYDTHDYLDYGVMRVKISEMIKSLFVSDLRK